MQYFLLISYITTPDDLSNLEGDCERPIRQGCVIAANVLTDGILIRRCYLIWNKRHGIILPLILVCIINNGKLQPRFKFSWSSGSLHIYITRTRYRAPIKTIAILHNRKYSYQSFINAFTGRIVYISQEIRTFSLPSTRRMYQTVISATLESGLLYPLTLIIYGSTMIAHGKHIVDEIESLKASDHLSAVTEVSYFILPTIMGIASTLIIVRTALGISVQDVQTFKSIVIDERSIIQFQPGVSGGAQSQVVEHDVTVDLESQQEAKQN
ncbi:hypothetical protein L218DRAFT_1006661 [Marasmius fiardii PR-910]|nr:hypothetical protein L218DRAFT_1006661 [Marasmius fiardii PR-910]